MEAYYAVVKALVAGGKDLLDMESLLADLQRALNLPGDAGLSQMERAEKDPEALALRNFDLSAQFTASARAAPAAMMQGHALPALAYDAGQYAQPAAKKQKKAGSSMGPPSTVPRASSGKSGQAPSSKSKSKSTPTTPTAQAAPQHKPAQSKAQPQPQATAQLQALPRASGLSQAALDAILARGIQAEMENYAMELHAREGEIFRELIQLNTMATDPDLNECHRALLQWYMLDARQAGLEHSLATAV